jgi:hypothetical protein
VCLNKPLFGDLSLACFPTAQGPGDPVPGGAPAAHTRDAQPHAAFILGRRADVLAANSLACALLADFTPSPGK